MPKVDYKKLYTLRPDGRYQGRWRDKNGVRHTVCDKDPAELYRKIQAKEAADTAPKTVTFADIAIAWHKDAEKVLRPGTWACYDSLYDRAIDELGDREAAAITTPDIKELLQRMADSGLSQKSCHNQKVVISRIYDFARNCREFSEIVKNNPATDAAMPRNAAPAKRREAPEDDVVRRIILHRDLPFGLFPLFLISTGMRRGEALAVRWRDIDFEAKTISVTGSVNYHTTRPEVTDTKTAAGVRTVPLLVDLEAALLDQPDRQRDRLVFHGENPTKPMADTTYRRRWANYCRDAGFCTSGEQECIRRGKKATKTVYTPTLTAHELRHGYATLLYEAGVDAITAQKLLGHADIETTLAVYTHLRKKQEAKSIGLLTSKIKLV